MSLRIRLKRNVTVFKILTTPQTRQRLKATYCADIGIETKRASKIEGLYLRSTQDLTVEMKRVITSKMLLVEISE